MMPRRTAVVHATHEERSARIKAATLFKPVQMCDFNVESYKNLYRYLEAIDVARQYEESDSYVYHQDGGDLWYFAKVINTLKWDLHSTNNKRYLRLLMMTGDIYNGDFVTASKILSRQGWRVILEKHRIQFIRKDVFLSPTILKLVSIRVKTTTRHAAQA